MISDKAAVIPLHLHPGFPELQRVQELKTALMTGTLAYVHMALDNAAGGLNPSSENPPTGL